MHAASVDIHVPAEALPLVCAPLFSKVHRRNIDFVNELERQFQRRGQVFPGLFIDPKVVY